MTVYLVIGSWNYEGDDVYGVVATKEDAEKMAIQARSDLIPRYNQVAVKEWVVGECK